MNDPDSPELAKCKAKYAIIGYTFALIGGLI